MRNLIRKFLGRRTEKEHRRPEEDPARNLDTLIEALDTDEEGPAGEGLAVLAQLAADHENRIIILNRILFHSSGLVRRRVPELLDLLADDPLEPLLEMYYSGDRQKTAGTLEIFRLRSNLMVPLLVDRLRGADADKGRRALEVLAAMGSDAVPNLLEALSDPSTAVRVGAALCLARMGDEARLAVTTLTEALKDDNQDVRFRAAFALKRMGGIEYQDRANAVIEELAEPLGSLDTLEIFVADSSLDRARIVADSPVVGELLVDSAGQVFLAPEEDYRGGGMGAVRALGHAVVLNAGFGKVVQATGVYDREIGFFAEHVQVVGPDGGR